MDRFGVALLGLHGRNQTICIHACQRMDVEKVLRSSLICNTQDANVLQALRRLMCLVCLAPVEVYGPMFGVRYSVFRIADQEDCFLATCSELTDRYFALMNAYSWSLCRLQTAPEPE